MNWFRRQTIMFKGSIVCVGLLLLYALIDRSIALSDWLMN